VETVAKPRASELTRVFNIVNDAKESGITLEAAGGAAALPVLDALVKEGRVRRVFDMMQVRVSTSSTIMPNIVPYTFTLMCSAQCRSAVQALTVQSAIVANQRSH
jgi:hypothetical protein